MVAMVLPWEGRSDSTLPPCVAEDRTAVRTSSRLILLEQCVLWLSRRVSPGASRHRRGPPFFYEVRKSSHLATMARFLGLCLCQTCDTGLMAPPDLMFCKAALECKRPIKARLGAHKNDTQRPYPHLGRRGIARARRVELKAS